MFIDELLTYFDSLKISEISREDYKKYVFKCYELYKQKMPGIPDNFEELKSFESVSDLTDRVLEYWSETNNTPNPFRKQENELVAKHEFFKKRKYVCAAPYTSLRFDVNGKMTVCCSNTDYPIGIYPETTPLEAWKGKAMEEIRTALERYDFSKGCQQCAKFILAGNAHNTVLVDHDKIIPNIQKHINSEWPAYIVFQHQNVCNYECIMCGGIYSSLIARNRDKKIQPNPYNNGDFLKHIEPFIPHAVTFEFLGGEPFLIQQHYKIWDMIKEKNPTAVVNIVSNGSIFNSKIEQLLKDLPRSEVHVSIDAVTPEIYSYIRRNGNINVVKENIRKLRDLKKLGSLTVCPMIQNIRDIPNIIEFCEEMNADIWFNDVQYALGNMWEDMFENGKLKRQVPLEPHEKPKELIKEFRLWMLPKKELQGHIEFLSSLKVSERYKDRLDSFINYLKNYVTGMNG